MQPFTLIFLAALAAATATRLWLARRHLRHILAHRGAVPVAFSAQVDLTSHQKAADYNCAKTRLDVVHALLEAITALVLTLGGGLQFAADRFALIDHELVRGVALIVGVVVALAAVEIPLGLHRVFVIEARFGFNRMTLPMYFADLAKQTLLAVLLGVPLLAAVLWLMARMGEVWWLYAWLVWAGFNLLAIAIFPTWIAPLFNKFTPLPEGALKTRIEALLAKCGFRATGGLFVMDGSKRSSHGNAYFTGFGKTKRIVFFDTLLSRLSEGEVEAVLAHELGHFKRRHVVKRIAWSFAASLALLWILGQLIHQPWFYGGLNVHTPSTAMALLLFFLVIPAFTFLLAPIASLYSRKHEFEADRYAAEHASGVHLVRALVKLYQDNAATLTPDPLHSAFHDSHPPAAARVARLQQAVHNLQIFHVRRKANRQD